MKIALTSFFVNDPAEAHTFYTEVLGFKSRMFMPEAKMAIVFSAEDPDGVNLMLEPKDNEIGKNFQESCYQSGIPAIVFTPDDIQKEYERLLTLGVKFRKTPTKNTMGNNSSV